MQQAEHRMAQQAEWRRVQEEQAEAREQEAEQIRIREQEWSRWVQEEQRRQQETEQRRLQEAEQRKVKEAEQRKVQEAERRAVEQRRALEEERRVQEVRDAKAEWFAEQRMHTEEMQAMLHQQQQLSEKLQMQMRAIQEQEKKQEEQEAHALNAIAEMRTEASEELASQQWEAEQWWQEGWWQDPNWQEGHWGSTQPASSQGPASAPSDHPASSHHPASSQGVQRWVAVPSVDLQAWLQKHNLSGVYALDAYGWSALHHVAMDSISDEVEGIFKELCSYHWEPEQLDAWTGEAPSELHLPSQWSALHILANRSDRWKRRGQMVKTLVAMRADPMRLSARSSTPLHMAAGTANFDVAQCLLLQPDVDVNAMNKDSKTPYDTGRSNAIMRDMLWNAGSRTSPFPTGLSGRDDQHGRRRGGGASESRQKRAAQWRANRG